MLALEVHINDSELFIIAADNLAFLSIFANINNGQDKIEISGADDLFIYTWEKKLVETGDRFVVRIIDVDKDKISTPKIRRIRDVGELRQRFERLKLQLQERKMI